MTQIDDAEIDMRLTRGDWLVLATFAALLFAGVAALIYATVTP